MGDAASEIRRSGASVAMTAREGLRRWYSVYRTPSGFGLFPTNEPPEGATVQYIGDVPVPAEWQTTDYQRQYEREERAHEKTVGKRDDAEQALSQAYFLVTGHPPEWSNNWGHAECLEDIGDAVALLKSAAKDAARATLSAPAPDEVVLRVRCVQNYPDLPVWEVYVGKIYIGTIIWRHGYYAIRTIYIAGATDNVQYPTLAAAQAALVERAKGGGP